MTTNTELRERFKQLQEDTFYPTLKIVAIEIGLGSYSDFCRWINGNHDYGPKMMEKIHVFLTSKGY